MEVRRRLDHLRESRLQVAEDALVSSLLALTPAELFDLLEPYRARRVEAPTPAEVAAQERFGSTLGGFHAAAAIEVLEPDHAMALERLARVRRRVVADLKSRYRAEWDRRRSSEFSE